MRSSRETRHEGDPGSRAGAWCGSSGGSAITDRVGEWFEAEALSHNGFGVVEPIDLAEVNLPFLNELIRWSHIWIGSDQR